MRQLQEAVKDKYHLQTMNSYNHDTSLTYVAATGAVCLSPDVFQDDNPDYAWLDFAMQVTIPCYLVTRSDCSPQVKEFVKILCDLYCK